MKTILVATDFTETGTNAANYALQLAHTWPATLTLVHSCLNAPEDSLVDGDNTTLERPTLRKSERALKRLVIDLNKRRIEPVSITYVLRYGELVPVILDVLQEHLPDLIVIPVSCLTYQRIPVPGRALMDMVHFTTVPILLFPVCFSFSPIKNVALVIDLKFPPQALAIGSVIQQIRQFGAIIHILCVSEHKDSLLVHVKAGYIRNLLRAVSYTLSVQSDNNVFETFISFAMNHKADLIITLPQADSGLGSLFEAELQELLRLGNIPVLAIA